MRLCVRCLSDNIDCEARHKVTDNLGMASYLCDQCYEVFLYEEQILDNLDIDEDEVF